MADFEENQVIFHKNMYRSGGHQTSVQEAYERHTGGSLTPHQSKWCALVKSELFVTLRASYTMSYDVVDMRSMLSIMKYGDSSHECEFAKFTPLKVRSMLLEELGFCNFTNLITIVQYINSNYSDNLILTEYKDEC